MIKIGLLAALCLLLGSSLSYAQANVSCNTQLTEGVTLTSDLTCDNTALAVRKDGIVLDCNGHTITYASKGKGFGIIISAANAVVKNCNIVQGSKFSDSYAVDLQGAKNSIIEGNSIKTIGSASHGTRLVYSAAKNSLQRNDIEVNGFDSYGVSIESGATENVLESNEVKATGDKGIAVRITHADKNTIKDSKFKSNEAAIAVGSSSDNLIFNNAFDGAIPTKLINVGANKWSVVKEDGSNIIGGKFVGGNFWASTNGKGFSQTCNDKNGDGICDSKNQLALQNVDNLPLAAVKAEVENESEDVEIIEFCRKNPANCTNFPEFIIESKCSSIEECENYCENSPTKCGFKERGRRVETIGPGGCSSKGECEAYCSTNPDECRQFEGFFKGSVEEGFEISIPEEIVEAGAEPEFMELTCLMVKSNVKKATSAVDVLKEYLKSVTSELGIELDTSKFDEFKVNLASRVEAICNSNINTFAQAIREMLSSFAPKDGEDPFDITSQIKEKLASKFDESQINALIQQMTAAYASGDVATGDTVREKLERLQKEGEELRAKAEKAFDRSALEEKIKRALEEKDEALEKQIEERQCNLVRKIIDFYMKDLDKEISYAKTQGIAVKELENLRAFIEGKRATLADCSRKTMQDFEKEVEAKSKEVQVKINNEVISTTAKSFFEQLSNQKDQMKKGIEIARELKVNGDAISRFENAVEVSERLEGKFKSGNLMPAELKLAGLELKAAWGDLRHEIEAKLK